MFTFYFIGSLFYHSVSSTDTFSGCYTITHFFLSNQRIRQDEMGLIEFLLCVLFVARFI